MDVDKLIEQEHITPMYKALPPLTRAGEGYAGVILYDTEIDKLHCHECGEWVDSLPLHGWHKHSLKGRDYRIKHGLPLLISLVSKEIFNKLSSYAKKREGNGTNSAKKFVKGEKRPSDLGKRNNSKYGKTSESHRNRYSGCNKQLLQRYLLIKDEVGKDPSGPEMIKYDSALLPMIRRRYVTLNNFKEKYGFAQYPHMAADKHSKESITLRINKYFETKAIAPTMEEVKVPLEVVEKIFGTWDKALSCSDYY